MTAAQADTIAQAIRVMREIAKENRDKAFRRDYDSQYAARIETHADFARKALSSLLIEVHVYGATGEEKLLAKRTLSPDADEQ